MEADFREPGADENSKMLWKRLARVLVENFLAFAIFESKYCAINILPKDLRTTSKGRQRHDRQNFPWPLNSLDRQVLNYSINTFGADRW